MAETTTTTWSPSFRVLTIRCATRLMPSASATDDPPYFCTTRATSPECIRAVRPLANQKPGAIPHPAGAPVKTDARAIEGGKYRAGSQDLGIFFIEWRLLAALDERFSAG